MYLCVCAGETDAPKAGRPFPSHQLLRRQDTLRAPRGVTGQETGASDGAFRGLSVPHPVHTHTHTHTHMFTHTHTHATECINSPSLCQRSADILHHSSTYSDLTPFHPSEEMSGSVTVDE